MIHKRVCLYFTGRVNEQYLLHVLLSLHMAQIMLGDVPTASTSFNSGTGQDAPTSSLPSTSTTQPISQSYSGNGRQVILCWYVKSSWRSCQGLGLSIMLLADRVVSCTKLTQSLQQVSNPKIEIKG